MKNFFVYDVLPCILAFAIVCLFAWAVYPTKQSSCEDAARRESALTACAADINCRSELRDYERFQRASRECLQR